MTKPLVIAVPKGRVLEQLVPYLEAAGLDTHPLTKRTRKLIRDADGYRYLMLKPDDVPTYVEYGAADLGVVGRDVLLERDYDLYAPLDLNIGVCRLCVAGASPEALRRSPLRVGTKFPNVTAKHFRAKGVVAEVIFLQGSVELAPLTGLSDVIVDIVESGETLRQNGLQVLEEVAPISTLVVANRVGLKTKQDQIRPLLDKLRRS